MRTMIIAGNWKMNKTPLEAIQLVEELKRLVVDTHGVEVVVCPPFIDLKDVSEVLYEHPISLGAQHVDWHDSGAFTGEISPLMLKDLNVSHVIVGHSERRQFFGETNETVNKRIMALLTHGLTPIVCVGENLAQREANETFDVIKNHIEGALKGLSEAQAGQLVIAYEPVWAIGTGKTASPEQAQEVHAYIRKLLAALFSQELAASIRIQYGGSVTPENAAGLLAKPDIDGALVGGASLKASSFAAIVAAAKK